MTGKHTDTFPLHTIHRGRIAAWAVDGLTALGSAWRTALRHCFPLTGHAVQHGRSVGVVAKVSRFMTGRFAESLKKQVPALSANDP